MMSRKISMVTVSGPLLLALITHARTHIVSYSYFNFILYMSPGVYLLYLLYLHHHEFLRLFGR